MVVQLKSYARQQWANLLLAKLQQSASLVFQMVKISSDATH